MVIIGAGGGIMRAGHGGPGRSASFGVAIRLPIQTNANEFIVGDSKLINFRYFFTRKLIFMWQAHSVALSRAGSGPKTKASRPLPLSKPARQ